MNGFREYKEIALTTQTGPKLIVLLYDGALRFLNLALEALEKGDYDAKGLYISRAQDIIIELNSALDIQNGNAIVHNLRALYNFMYTHLTQANSAKDPLMIKEVITILEELNTAFKAIC